MMDDDQNDSPADVSKIVLVVIAIAAIAAAAYLLTFGGMPVIPVPG